MPGSKLIQLRLLNTGILALTCRCIRCRVVVQVSCYCCYCCNGRRLYWVELQILYVIQTFLLLYFISGDNCIVHIQKCDPPRICCWNRFLCPFVDGWMRPCVMYQERNDGAIDGRYVYKKHFLHFIVIFASHIRCSLSYCSGERPIISHNFVWRVGGEMMEDIQLPWRLPKPPVFARSRRVSTLAHCPIWYRTGDCSICMLIPSCERTWLTILFMGGRNHPHHPLIWESDRLDLGGDVLSVHVGFLGLDYLPGCIW